MIPITLFTIPKPFAGHIGTIQRNALQSWLRFGPYVEVLLYGDEVGASETAIHFNIKHFPSIKKNEYGTPLLDFVFEHAAETSKRPLLCYVNSDIILLRDFFQAISRIHLARFLMVGQRWNLNVTDILDFSVPNVDSLLIQKARKEGALYPPYGADYFVYPRSVAWALPKFAVGRPGWDNWLIYKARASRIPVVDATPAVMAIHQNHNYDHVPAAVGNGWEGIEADINRRLAGGSAHFLSIADATHVLSKGRLRRAISYRQLKRSLFLRGIRRLPR